MSTSLSQAERTKLINKIYSKMHRDYKSNSNGVKKIMIWTDKGTSLVECAWLDDAKLLELSK